MFEMTRWDPLQEMMSLREAMNRLMEESFLIPSRTLGGAGMETSHVTTHGVHLGSPALDIQEQGDNFMVRATLPGVRPEDVRIEAHGNQVTLSGQVRQEQEAERGNYLVRERRIGQFSRTFTLPTDVNPETAEANYANGILTLRLPKTEATRARQIPIRAGGEQRLESGQTQMPGQGQGQKQQTMQGQGQTQGQTQMPGQGQGQYQTPGQSQGQTQMPGQGQGQGRPQQEG